MFKFWLNSATNKKDGNENVKLAYLIRKRMISVRGFLVSKKSCGIASVGE